MISVKDFEIAINEVEEATKFKNNVYKLITDLKYIPTDFMGEECILIGHESLVLKLLAEIFTNDEDKKVVVKEILDWYCYECDFGSDKKYNYYTNEKNEKVIIDSPSKLYEDILSAIK